MSRVAIGAVAVLLLAVASGAVAQGGTAAASAETAVQWPKEVLVEMPKDPVARAAKLRDLRSQYGRTVRTVSSRLRSRPGLDFQQTSVKNVLEYLAEIGHFSVIFDKELETQGIDLETRTVTLKVSGITYEKAIELVLPRECGYRVGPGYVLITTMEKAWVPLKTASYSIQLHLAAIPDFGGQAPRFEVGDVTQAAAQAAGGGGGAFGDLFGAGGGLTVEDEGRPTPEKIIDLVKRFVRHDTDRRVAPWADEGGPATVEYLNGHLIVSQTDAGHRAVLRFLTMLE